MNVDDGEMIRMNESSKGEDDDDDSEEDADEPLEEPRHPTPPSKSGVLAAVTPASGATSLISPKNVEFSDTA